MADRYVTVARVDEVPPGSVRTVRAGEEEIALAHVDGEFYATQYHCLHLRGLPQPVGHRAARHVARRRVAEDAVAVRELAACLTQHDL